LPPDNENLADQLILFFESWFLSKPPVIGALFFLPFSFLWFFFSHPPGQWSCRVGLKTSMCFFASPSMPFTGPPTMRCEPCSTPVWDTALTLVRPRPLLFTNNSAVRSAWAKSRGKRSAQSGCIHCVLFFTFSSILPDF